MINILIGCFCFLFAMAEMIACYNYVKTKNEYKATKAEFLMIGYLIVVAICFK